MFRNPQKPEATVLTAEETNYLKAMVTARAERDHLKQALEEAHRRIEFLKENCTHEVFADMPAFPYSWRYCSICGTALGQVLSTKCK